MRFLLAIPLLLVAACNVSTDANNDSVTLQYNEDAAEEVGNAAENIGTAIGNEAEDLTDGNTAENEAANETANETANQQ